MALNLSSLIGELTAPPEQDPLAELERRLDQIRNRTMQTPGQTQVGPGSSMGLNSLLAPYQSAVTGAPTDFSGTMFDPLAAVKAIERQRGKGGNWSPSFQGGMGGGVGNIITKNGIGMAAPAMRSLMQLKNQLGVQPLGNASGGFRSHAQQKALYAAYLNGTHPALVAKPGTSLHEKGLAIDFNTDWITAKAQAPVRRWLLQHGWYNDVPGEPWHWSFRQSG